MPLATLLHPLRRAAGALLLGLACAAAPVRAQALDPMTGEVIPASATLERSLLTETAEAPRNEPTLTLIKRLAEGETRGLAVVGDVLYRSNGGYLEALDVSDPAAAVVLSRVEVNQSVVHDVFVDGDHAYLVSVRASFPQQAGLYVVDVSDPSAMQIVGQAVGQSGYGVVATGGYAYVGAATAGFSVYDVSNPAAPSRLTTLNVGGSVLNIVLDGDHAYASAGAGGLRVISLANPAAPTLVGSLALDGFATNVAYADGVAYVLVNDVGIRAVDVSNPAAPTLISTYAIPSGQIRGIEIVGDRAMVTSEYGLEVVDISNPAAMAQIGHHPFGRTGTGQSVSVVGPVAYTGHRFDGVRVIDIADETAPGEIAHVPNGGFSFKVFVQGDYAYVSDLIGEYRIIDLSNPAQASVVGRAPALPNTSNSTVRDGVAYVVDRTGDGTSGLSYYDVSDPTNPTLIDTYVTGGQSFGIDLSGETAFIANGFFSFLSMDLGPTPPVVLDEANPNSAAYDVRVRDDVAYVTTFGGGLATFDVSNPSAMAPLSLGAVGGFSTSLTFGDDGLLYLADGNMGLRVVDASDPGAPVSLGTSGIAGIAVGVAYANGYAYIADEGYGLRQIDVSDPSAPVLAATFISSDRMVDVATVGNLVVAVDAGGGVYLFQGPGGVAAEPSASPEAFVLDSAYPNPFSAGTTVRYYLPEAGAVRVSVYSLLGQRVATLVDGPQAAGWQEAAFSAQGLAAGTYLVRVEAGGQSAVRRVTLVR